MLTTYLFRYTPFRSQIFKIFFASGGKRAHGPPNQNPADALVRSYTPAVCQRHEGRGGVSLRQQVMSAGMHAEDGFMPDAPGVNARGRMLLQTAGLACPPARHPPNPDLD